jgi:hypothetical protein
MTDTRIRIPVVTANTTLATEMGTRSARDTAIIRLPNFVQNEKMVNKMIYHESSDHGLNNRSLAVVIVT